MITEKEKARLKRKFKITVEETSHIFDFENFELKDKIKTVLTSNGVHLENSEVLWIFFLAINNFSLISKSILFSTFDNKVNICQLKSIKDVSPEVKTKEISHLKGHIDEIRITTFYNKTFIIKFADQEELFVFLRLLKNVAMS